MSHCLVLFDLFTATHDYCLGTRIVLRAAGASNHLLYFNVGIIAKAGGCAGPHLNTLDNDEVCREIDANRQRRCADDDLKFSVAKGVLDHATITQINAAVVESNALVDKTLENGVLYLDAPCISVLLRERTL